MQYKLSKLGDTKSGIGFPTKEQNGNKGLPFYKVSDMNLKENKIDMTVANNYVSKEQINNNNWKPITKNPSIIFAKVGAALLLNRKRYVNHHFLIDNNMMAYSPNEYLHARFTKYLFDTLYLPRFAQIGALPSIKGKDIKDLKVIIPKHEEQKPIAKILNKIEQIITLEQEKINLLMKLKDYIQSALINKKDSKNSLKFEGFEEVWKLYTLGDVGTYYNGLSGKTKKDFGHGKAKYLTYTNINQNPIARRQGVDKIEIDSKQNKIASGDVLFTTSSETPEEAGLSSVWIYNDKNVYLNSFCFGFRFNFHTNPYFMTYNLRSDYFRKQMFVLAQGTSRYNISKINAMKLKLLIPGIEEQNKIGKIFQSLDSLIIYHKNRLEKVTLVKKILLQNMFI